MPFKLTEGSPDGDNSPKLSPVEFDLKANGGVVGNLDQLEYFVEKGSLGFGPLERKYGEYYNSIRYRNNGDPQKCQWELRNTIDQRIIDRLADEVETSYKLNSSFPESFLSWMHVLEFAMGNYLEDRRNIGDFGTPNTLLEKYNDFNTLLGLDEQGRKLLGLLEYKRKIRERRDTDSIDGRSGREER